MEMGNDSEMEMRSEMKRGMEKKIRRNVVAKDIQVRWRKEWRWRCVAEGDGENNGY
jgi:hypothetical protein